MLNSIADTDMSKLQHVFMFAYRLTNNPVIGGVTEQQTYKVFTLGVCSFGMKNPTSGQSQGVLDYLLCPSLVIASSNKSLHEKAQILVKSMSFFVCDHQPVNLTVYDAVENAVIMTRTSGQIKV